MSAPPPASRSSPHLLDLLQTVHKNLLHQADWSSLEIHSSPSYPRPLITGLPPDPVYIDPDSASDYSADNRDAPERDQQEWVLPVDLREKWTLRKWAEVFDSLPEGFWGLNKEGKKKGKRLLLAVVSEDSTIVHYIVHDGIVKPRQN